MPAPVVPTANIVAITTSGYSYPPCVTHGPFGPWTAPMAFTITPMIIIAVSSVFTIRRWPSSRPRRPSPASRAAATSRGWV